MKDISIEVTEVSKHFKSTLALDEVSFGVKRASILGLLGPNGAGKTTMIRILTTLIKPDKGHVNIDGYDVVKDGGKIRKIIGLAGQYAAVDDYLTGKENLKLVGGLYHLSSKEAEARAVELLKRFDLQDAASRTVKTYSGGMRRRLDLAASLVNRPNILLLDEPTTGLDPRSRINLWQSIKNLVKTGTTVLLTTQYLEEADNLCDDLVVLGDGKTIAKGTPDELKASVGGDLVEFTLSDIKRMDETLNLFKSNLSLTPKCDAETGQISVALELNKSLGDVVRALDERQILVTGFTMRRPSLDEVFLSLTSISELNTKEGK